MSHNCRRLGHGHHARPCLTTVDVSVMATTLVRVSQLSTSRSWPPRSSVSHNCRRLGHGHHARPCLTTVDVSVMATTLVHVSQLSTSRSWPPRSSMSHNCRRLGHGHHAPLVRVSQLPLTFGGSECLYANKIGRKNTPLIVQ